MRLRQQIAAYCARFVPRLSEDPTASPAACAILSVMSLVRWTLWLTVAGLAACGAIVAAATWLRPDPQPCLDVFTGNAACAAPEASVVVVGGAGVLGATAVLVLAVVVARRQWALRALKAWEATKAS